MDSIVGFVLMFGIVVTLLILLSLFSVKHKDIPRYVLLFFFVTIFMVNISAYASLHNLEAIYLLTFPFDFIIVWLIGPLLLLYIRSLFESKNVLKRNAVHFILIGLILVLVAFPLVISALEPSFSLSYLTFLEDNQNVIIILRDVYCIGYLLFTFQQFMAYREQLEQNYANISIRDFAWIKRLLVFCISVVLLDLVMNIYELIWMNTLFHSGFIIMVFIIVMTVYLGYYGIKQSSVLLPSFLTQQAAEKEINIKKTALTAPDQQMEALKQKFISQSQKEKYHRQDDLTLQKLAAYFEVTDKKLSLLLNQYIGQSFSDYINQLRIEEVKEKLVNPENNIYTILAIAFDCGFNSKATFNRIFKKETGLTPSQYRKKFGNKLP